MPDHPSFGGSTDNRLRTRPKFFPQWSTIQSSIQPANVSSHIKACTTHRAHECACPPSPRGMPARPILSVFARRFAIPSIDSDISQWDQAWERVLPTLSTLQDVFSVLSEKWQPNQPGTSAQSVAPKDLEERLRRSQELIAKLWEELSENVFVHLWLLLREGERRTHLFNGIKWACEYASLGQDARALCPEITVSTMLKHKGWGFVLLAGNCADGVNKVGRGVNVAHLWSTGWCQATVSVPAHLAEETKFQLAALTLHREEFIAAFILLTITSVLRDLNYTSPIAILLKSEDFFTIHWKNPPRPRQMRCEHCTGSAEELGKRLKFMMCGRCKANAQLPAVYYCSRPCQKADWKTHKSRCGIQGKPTSVDSCCRYWTFYVPEHAQAEMSVPLAQDFIRGALDERTPDPSRPRSPALQRQISLLKADKAADYFLFDEADHPVRFMIPEEDKWKKISFRFLREDALSGNATDAQVEAIAEYLIQNMSDRPGLSRARILAQFCREYGPAKARSVIEFERRGIIEGYSVGTSFLEEMSKDMQMSVLTQR